jgi:beta-glucosidase
MNTKTCIALLSSLLWVLAAPPVQGQAGGGRPIYLDSTATVASRVKDLLSRMTLEEKIAQLQCSNQDMAGGHLPPPDGSGNIAPVLRKYPAREAADAANRIQKLLMEKTRLGIPAIIHDEGLHGLVGKAATSFPQAIGLASTFDTALMEEVATVIAREARTRGIRQLLSPVVNIARDVRWGRVEETYGEDPYLSSRMGVAFCRSLEENGVIATPKHYVANVGDGGRDSYPVEYSQRLLREVYFPPFKACFQEGHATSVMAAYNALDGLPCSANPWLLTEVLRGEWGFQGFVVSDYGSVGGIVGAHHTAATKEQGAKEAIEAGLDVELPDVYLYGAPLLKAVNDGMVPVSTIDVAVSRVLGAKFRLGLFDHPAVDPAVADRTNATEAHRKLAFKAACEAIVLLKNDHGVLPLKKDLKSLAVIGPEADAVSLGDYSGFGMKVVTPLEGIRQCVSKTTRVVHEKGCDLTVSSLPTIPAEYLVPPGAGPGEHGLKGEYFNNMQLEGQPALVRVDKQVQFDWNSGPPGHKVNADHFSVRWTGRLTVPTTRNYRLSASTDDGVRLFVGGNCVIDNWHDRAASADIVTMHLQAGKEYDIRMEYYQNEGGASADLGWDFKPTSDPRFEAAVEAARHADAAVIFVGINEGEGEDRANLDLPGAQEKLITAVAETGVPTVVVLVNGSAVTMSSWVNNVSAILEEWYGGEEGGNAIAAVLFGDYNPGARLPVTFPLSVGQVPLYYDHKPSGRGDNYVDLSGKPLFPFGYGLSYTRFEYSNLTITPSTITPAGTVTIAVDVRNVGERKGDEVVQLYLHDGVRTVTRPVKELKGFQRITLGVNEHRTVTFTLGPDDLSFFDEHLRPVVEEGSVDVLLGGSSEDIRQKGTFTIARP